MKQLYLGLIASMSLGLNQAIADDVQIACSVSQAQTFIGSNLLAAELGGPINLIITPEGLQTPFGGNCALMLGQVSPARVAVACVPALGDSPPTMTMTIVIDRALGTFNQTFDIVGAKYGNSRTTKAGTCQRRASF